MKYNITSDFNILYDHKMQDLVRNGEVNIAIECFLDRYLKNKINIHIVTYSEHLSKYRNDELIKQFYLYAFGDTFSIQNVSSPIISVRYIYGKNGKKNKVFDYSHQISITLDQLDLVPVPVINYILMNLDTLS